MKVLNLSLLSVCAIGLVACGGAKDKVNDLASGMTVTGGAAPATPASGPSLEGKWDSGCISDPLTSGGLGKRRITIQSEGANLEHNVISYADSECRQANREQDGARKGTYSFAKAGVVELKMPLDGNASALFYFAAAVEGDVLKVGELGGFDSAVSDTPAIALKKQAAEVPQGKHSLEAGVYTPDPATDGVKDIAISTAEVNGVATQVFMEIQNRSQSKATLSCEADTCKGSDGQVDYVLKIKNAQAFEISMPAFNVTVNYKKR